MDYPALLAAYDKSEAERNKLQQERNELAATVEAWKAAFDHLFGHCLSNGVFNAWSKQLDCTLLNEASSKSPQQHLRDVRAEAVIDAIKKSVVFVCFDVPCVSVNALRNYAESVKAGEK